MTAPANPAAFPSEQHERQDGSWNDTYCDGMSLRDWFAGQAVGAIVRQCAHDSIIYASDQPATVEEYFAQKAYRIADAMLAERTKATGQ